MADTPKGETVVQEPPKNDVTPVAAPQPVVNSNDNSELETLKKEKEQAEMRANQLANQLKAKDEAEAEAKRKQLEEQEEWKTIAEQEKTKREALENERDEAETKQTLRLSEETIFAEFSPEAIEVAKEAGLSLTDNTDEAKETFKTKLQKISDRVVQTNNVTPNNPGQVPQSNDRAEQVQKMRNGDKQARTEVISGLKSLDFMRKQSGYSQEQ